MPGRCMHYSHLKTHQYDNYYTNTQSPVTHLYVVYIFICPANMAQYSIYFYGLRLCALSVTWTHLGALAHWWTPYVCRSHYPGTVLAHENPSEVFQLCFCLPNPSILPYNNIQPGRKGDAGAAWVRSRA